MRIDDTMNCDSPHMKLAFLRRCLRIRLLLSISAFILSMLLLTTFSFASFGTTVFGSKRYDLGHGQPADYTDEFKGCPSGGKTMLRITNWDDDRTKITAPEILVNRIKVADEDDFKWQGASFEKVIFFQDTNTLTVKLQRSRFDYDDRNYGHRGDFPFLAQNCGLSDSTPPTILNPRSVDGSLLNNAAPAISAQYADESGGSGVDATSSRLVLDGKDVTSVSLVSASGISYLPPSNLPEGANTATVNVLELAHNPVSLAWHFTTNTIAPTVKITSQQNNQYLNTPSIGFRYDQRSDRDRHRKR